MKQTPKKLDSALGIAKLSLTLALWLGDELVMFSSLPAIHQFTHYENFSVRISELKKVKSVPKPAISVEYEVIR